MFSSQCEQTAGGEACYKWGACGKSPEVDALQDLLTYTLRGLGQVALAARQVGIVSREVDAFTCETLFSTLTNVDFDAERFIEYINRSVALRDALKAQVQAIAPQVAIPEGPATFEPAQTLEGLVQQGKDVEFEFISKAGRNTDIFSLKLTILYGIKGIAAYAYHAGHLGHEDPAIGAFLHEALASLDSQELSLEDWVG